MARRYYLECEAGVAGDMLVGALLDLGADESKLKNALESLPLDGYTIQIRRVKKAGIDACDFDVVLDDAHQNHDHDMEYLHGKGVEEGHGHSHHHAHLHDHSHAHRHLSDIEHIIDAGDLTKNANALAKKIFRIVAESESKAHALPIEEVHFHEVGAVDSIVDIVSIAVCMDDLGIDSLIVPYLCEGQGTVRCAHGILPIPVPAVQNITQVHAIPLRRIDVKGEFVTPTGAAAVAAFRSEEALPSTYIVRRTGIGAGKRQYERASMVRLMEIETTDETSDFVWRLETDIDDSSAERLGYLMNSLFIAGAREVHYAPIYMKKNRPGVELVVLCDDATRESIENRIFEETTTIGIRRVRMGRTVLARSFEEFQTEFGTLAAKRVRLPDGRSRIYPEYEEVVSLAERSGKSFFEAWSFVEKLIQEGK